MPLPLQAVGHLLALRLHASEEGCMNFMFLMMCIRASEVESTQQAPSARQEHAHCTTEVHGPLDSARAKPAHNALQLCCVCNSIMAIEVKYRLLDTAALSVAVHAPAEQGLI